MTTNLPPQSLINRLENRASKPAASKFSESVITPTAIPPVVNNIYTIDPYGRPKTPNDTAAAPSTSSPIFMEGDICHDDILCKYGLWHEQRVSSKLWKNQIRNAVKVCYDEYLCLEYARKKPLSWWVEKGIKEGIARMFCDHVTIFKWEKEKGWVRPKPTVKQRFVNWMDHTLETSSFVSIDSVVDRVADGVGDGVSDDRSDGGADSRAKSGDSRVDGGANICAD